jgi:hypothetical protein
MYCWKGKYDFIKLSYRLKSKYNFFTLSSTGIHIPAGCDLLLCQLMLGGDRLDQLSNLGTARQRIGGLALNQLNR